MQGETQPPRLFDQQTEIVAEMFGGEGVRIVKGHMMGMV